MDKRATYLATALVGAAMGLTGAIQTAAAGDAVFLNNDATQCDIFRALSRVVPSECAQAGDAAAPAPVFRGIVRHDLAAAQPQTQAVQPAVTQANPPQDLAIAMRVEFAFDSYELTGEARRILDEVAAVINHELMNGKVIQIEGHADATGSADYNMTLSQRRAQAVQRYLAEVHHVDFSRVPAIGKGETEPFDVADPTAGINRRVEFRNITG